MKRMVILVLAFVLCFTFVFAAHEGSIKTTAATSAITMIVTNPAEDASHAMNINFHAALGYTNCYVQYTTVDDTAWANAQIQTGSYVTYGANSSNPFYNQSAKNDAGTNITQTVTFLDYSVTLSALMPATHYMYRISDGTNFTETYRFKTAGAEEWSFVVTGDFHEYYKTYGGQRIGNATKAINAAISLAKQNAWADVEHIVGIGDIVAWGVDYGQWKNVYDTNWIKNYSFANTLGNHDAMDRNSVHINNYNIICNNYPLNGYGNQIGNCFYYIYNNVLFIYTSYLDTSAEAEAWANNVVKTNQGRYKYSVLVNHYPAISKYSGTTYSGFWNTWADFCDTNNIDLVLAGDHHVYTRTHPIYNGNIVSDYGPANPNGTVYIAADSADGDRGTDGGSEAVTSNWNSKVATHYYRYEYSGSAADITAMVINVGKDRMTTQFVYYENKTSNHPYFKQGSVSGHSSFFFGDTSFVYPSDHGYQGSTGGDTEDETGLPAAAKNYLHVANGGTYKYPTNVYPGSASYYTYSYYGDNNTTGGNYMSGKLNNGVFPADSNPGSSNNDWAVFFLSQGAPELYFNLPESIYINNISLVYRNYVPSNYGQAIINSVAVGEADGSYSLTYAYNVTHSISAGSNNKITLSFTEPVKAKYIRLLLSKPSEGTRVAIGEAEVWGDTTVPDIGKFELVEDSAYKLNESFVRAAAPLTKAADIKEQFACKVSIFTADGTEVADDALVGTGFMVKKLNSAGEVKNEVAVVIPGDISGDGDVNTLDYVAVKNIMKGNTSCGEANKEAADVVADGTIGSADYILIRNYCKGSQTIKG